MDKKKFLYTQIGLALFFMIISIISIYFSHISKGQLFVGDDLNFHKMRIEGLYEALSNHVYFPRINMTFMKSMGYASSIFYSDFFLYFPAILRLLGFSLSEAYVALIVVINFSTFIVAYFSMQCVEQKFKKSIFFSILYTLSTYRLYDLNGRAALGEILAIVFFPLAFMGLYHIIYGNSKKWYILSIGMSLIILSHVISAVMFSLFILIFLIISRNELFNSTVRLKNFIKSVLLTLPLTAFYFIPMMEQMKSQTFKMTTHQWAFMSQTAQRLDLYFNNSLSNDGLSANIGIILLMFLIAYIFSNHKIKNKSVKNIFYVGLIFLLMATNLFPWHLLEKTFFNTIQFPWRFFALVTLCLCWVVAEDSLEILNSSIVRGVLLVLVILFSVSSSLVSNQKPGAIIMPYREFNIPLPNEIGWGQEYLPENADYGNLMNRELNLSYDKSTVSITNYTKNRDVVSFEFETLSESTITMPLIYYKGYVSEFNGIGTISEPFLNENEDSLVSITVNGNGVVKVYYKETTLQTLSKYVSLVSWILFLFYMAATKINRPNSPLNIKNKAKNDHPR